MLQPQAGSASEPLSGFHDFMLSALQAEKAEGYINLTNFMIDRAIECKKKQ